MPPPSSRWATPLSRPSRRRRLSSSAASCDSRLERTSASSAAERLRAGPLGSPDPACPALSAPAPAAAAPERVGFLGLAARSSPPASAASSIGSFPKSPPSHLPPPPASRVGEAAAEARRWLLAGLSCLSSPSARVMSELGRVEAPVVGEDISCARSSACSSPAASGRVWGLRLVGAARTDAWRVCGCWDCWGGAASGSGAEPLPTSRGGRGGPLPGPSELSSAIGASVGGVRVRGAAGGARVGVDEARRATATCLSCAAACGSCQGWMAGEAGRSARQRARAGHAL